MDPKDKVRFDASTQKPTYRDQKPKGKTYAPHGSQKKKTCQYFGNTRHVEKVCYKK
jgi:hypothetical protein